MRVTLTGRQVDITPTLKELVEKRLAKIERRLNDAALSAQVVLSREKNRYVVELTVHAKQDHMLHGLGRSVSWSTALTAAVQRVVQQADKVKGKWQVRKRGSPTVRKLSRA
jgi:putative sigma-54 modulation protein